MKLQYLIPLSSLGSLADAIASCPPSPCKGGVYALVATALAGYQPAVSFCSSKYPVPTQVCSSTAPLITITSTVSTSIYTTTVASVYETITPATVTSTDYTTTTPTSFTTITNTETDTETSTATSTATTTVTASTVTVGANAKRNAIPATYQNALESKLSSLKTQLPTYVAAVCTCINKPATTTVTSTPSTTQLVTATITTSVTYTGTSTVTAVERTTSTITASAVTSTQTDTATTTSTTTATTTTTTTISATATAYVNFGCAPDYQGSTGFVGFAHNCGTAASCFCIPRYSNGEGTCTNGEQGCGPACTADSQCATGRACLKGISVCGAADQGHCEQVMDQVCFNGGSPSRMFRRRSEKRSGLEPETRDVLPYGTRLINGKIVGVDD